MPRYAAKISEQDLVDKIVEAYNEYDKSLPPITNHLDMHFGLGYLTPQVEKDLSKIEFDRENRCGGPDCFCFDTPDIMEVHTTPDGFTYYGCLMGGDWEFPIYFIIYWDGKQLRGYIPTKGQCYDVKSKTAIGSGEDEGPEEPLHNPDELLADIEERIEIPGVVKKNPKRIPRKTPVPPVLSPITSDPLFPINHNPPIWSTEAEAVRVAFYTHMKSCGDPSKRGEYHINLCLASKELARIINNPAVSVIHIICALERIVYENPRRGIEAIGYAMGELYGNPNSKTASPVMTERYGHILASGFLAKSLIDECYIQESEVREARAKFPLLGSAFATLSIQSLNKGTP